ncbi:MAG: ABC transporter permease [Spirochaetaceae bacterium]|jgi:ribose transport system permease protein|nr:ABC transporter permease [Spirochaetaceae bacterium]
MKREDNSKKNYWSFFQKMFPFIGLLAIIIVFSIISGSKLWTVRNLKTIISTMIPLCIGGMGMIFVAAQGSTDMSQGSLLALAATLGGVFSIHLGFWAFVPGTLLVGLLIGIFNGAMLSRLKVPSLMVTLAMLIALRALVIFFTTSGEEIKIDPRILMLNRESVKYPIFIVLAIIMWYLFDFTKAGFFSKCIGENQVVGQFAGIPVKTYKTLAFALSGLMAGFVGIFSVGRIGGIAPTMGNFFELQVMTAMFVGGVPVTGGASSKFYKVLVGSLMLAFLQNGLTISRVPSEISELIQGLILLGVVFLGLLVHDKFLQRQTALAAKESE